jgi:putative tryptophan/tyrosine transport system substrate-binding protein
MNRRIIIWLLTTLFLTVSSFAAAQQSKKVPRIGLLLNNPTPEQGRQAIFRQALRDLGWIEGENIVIEYRYAGGKSDRFPELAAELVRLKVDIIFAIGAPAAQAAKNATRTIPIVTSTGDPVGTGLVASLASPGGNVTGVANFTPELVGKRLELLKEVRPQISRVAILWSPDMSGAERWMEEAETAAASLSIKRQPVAVRGPNDLEQAFAAMKKERAGGLVPLRSPLIINQLKRIVELAGKSRLPALYDDSEFTEAGGLMSYGTLLTDLDRRAAIYVDKILKGTKPSDLPVEQPMKFEFVINLKTAKQIGLTIPPNVLARADKVIK